MKILTTRSSLSTCSGTSCASGTGGTSGPGCFGGPAAIVLWTSSEFLQLVLLPIIIVGQNIQAKASDARAEDTYKDAEAIMHECIHLQAHLQAQDQVLTETIDRVRKLAASFNLVAPAIAADTRATP